MELKNKTMQAVKWNFLATALGTVVGIVQLWALSHILAPAQYGIISVALMVVTFFNIFIDFGISNAIIRRQNITELELSSLYAINVGLGVATFLAVYFSSPLIAIFFKSPELEFQIRIMSFLFLMAPFGQQQRAILARDMRFNFIAIVTIVTLLTNFVVVVGLALLYQKAWAASVAFLVSGAVNAAIFFIHSLRERKFSLRFSWPAAKPHIRYSLQLVSDSMINVVSINTYPALMARLVSLSAIGGYNIANSISIMLIERLKPVLTQALFPAFAKIQNDDSRLATNFLLVTTYGSLVNFPLLVGMFVASSSIVATFFNAEWQFIDSLVKILCLVGIFRSLDVPVISLLLVKAKMYLNVRMGIVKLVTGAALAYLLGTRYGITGIVCSFLIVQIGNTVLGYFVLVRACLQGLGRAYIKAVLIPLAQALPILLVSGLITLYPPSAHPSVNLALVVGAGVLAYLLGLYFSPFAVVREFVGLASRNVSPKLETLLLRRAK